MSSPLDNPGAALAGIITNPTSLGFIPVAVHFDIFTILARAGKPITAEEVTEISNAKIRERAKGEEPELGVKLAEDTLYIMTGLGLVDQVSENVFGANAITKHLADWEGATNGALHFSIEGLLAGAFTYSKLKDTNFAYPFAEADTPMQYAHKRLGNEVLSKKHTYSIMADEGRMDSFNMFMVQKFSKMPKAPENIKSLGYDLDAAISSAPKDSVAVVDIGGGHGHTLLSFKEAYPHLSADKLIVQDFYATIDTIPGLTLMKYNFKDTAPQPVQGAHIYCLQHILHNHPDLESIALLQKTAAAMNDDSRLLIIESTKNANNAAMHAAMVALYGGRERSSEEWKLMAAVSGLEVTFESYPEFGECLVEMRKVRRSK